MSPTVVEVLGANVSIPDPEAVERLANLYSGVADRLAQTGDRVRAIGRAPDWQGLAADQFLEGLTFVVGDLAAGTEAFGRLTGTLRAYAESLRGWVTRYVATVALANDVDAELQRTKATIRDLAAAGPLAAALTVVADGLSDELARLRAQLAGLIGDELPALARACAAAIRAAEGSVPNPGLPGVAPQVPNLPHVAVTLPRVLEDYFKKLLAMTPQERAGFVSHLSNADLRAWNLWLTLHDVISGRYNGDAADQARLDLANLLLAGATRAELARLEKEMPYLFPNPDIPPDANGDPGVYPNGCTSLAGLPLFGVTGGPALQDMNQGEDGDCWFLSSLNAVGMVDPSLIEKDIHANPNGTYTVTFYQDGKPVQVTLTDDVPEVKGGFGASTAQQEGYAYAYPGADDAKWVAIYEKAYAQLNGGYANINGGWPSVALPAITGQSSPAVLTSSVSLSQLHGDLKAHEAVVAVSVLSGPEYVDGGKVVTAHAYMVQSVDLGAHPPTVTLVNPWGRSQIGAAQGPYQVTLTKPEFDKYFSTVNWVKP